MSISEWIEDEEYGWIKEEMQSTKEAAMQKLKSIVHPSYETEFLRVLTTAWNAGCQDAVKLAKELNLSLIEFVAIEGDEELFAKIQLEEMWG